MKSFKTIYLLLACNGLTKHMECVFEKQEDANNYATFLINSELAENYTIRPIKYWYE